MKRFFGMAVLVSLAASVAEAGIVRFAAKRVVKPVVVHSAHASKKVVKVIYKVAI